MSTKEPSIDPYPAIQEKPFESIKDRESFFKRMKGTMGKNIPYTEEDEERKRTNGKR